MVGKPKPPRSKEHCRNLSIAQFHVQKYGKETDPVKLEERRQRHNARKRWLYHTKYKKMIKSTYGGRIWDCTCGVTFESGRMARQHEDLLPGHIVSMITLRVASGS